MNLPLPSIDLTTFELGVLIWPLLFGIGAYLLLTAQPIGRPKPNLAERLRRLDVDARIREEFDQSAHRPIFSSRVLEGLLRPVLDDVGQLLQAGLSRLGLTSGADLNRQLALVRPGVNVAQFFGEKVVSGLIGLALIPVMEGLGIHPFGPWPVWVAILGGAIGFLGPDWELDRRVAARRLRCLMELPATLDLLTLACSSGLSLEQALSEVARPGSSIVATELHQAVREMALGQRSLIEALETMADRNGVPALAGLVNHLRLATNQGLPLVESLAIQAETLREHKRLRIVADGGQASIRMIIPVAVFILPVLFVVLLVPAAEVLLHLAD